MADSNTTEAGREDYYVWMAWLGIIHAEWDALRPDVRHWWATNSNAKGAADYVRNLKDKTP